MVYVALGILRVGPAWAAPDRLAQCGCGDGAFVMWFLGWTPFAATHGHGLFFTDWMFYPAGFNTLWNVSLLLPGLLMGPVTVHWGVVVSYNVLVVVAFAGSAVSAYLVLRRWAPWPPAAFAGGLLYGFSPYMIGQGIGHLHMVLLALVPVALLLLDEILVRQWRPAWLTGPLLGGVLAAQFFTAEEVLAGLALVAVLGLLVLLALFPRSIRPRLGHGAAGLGLATVTALAITAWPLKHQFAGPQRLNGTVSDPGRYRADLLSWVVPSRLVRHVSEAALQVSADFPGNLSENGSYLGIPLLAVVLVTAILLWRRRPVVRWALVMLVLVMAFASGRSLHVRGEDTGIWMPLALLHDIPLLQSIVGVRLAAFAVLLAAMLLAVGLDALYEAVRTVPAPASPGAADAQAVPAGQAARRWLRSALATVLAVAVALVALAPLQPRSLRYPIVGTGVPAWFTSASALGRVPPGSVLLSVPWASAQNAAPMLWQAEAGYRFKSPGGYALNPGPDGRGTFNPPPSRLLSALTRFRLGRPPRVSAARIVQMRVELLGWDVRTIVVVAERNRNLGEQIDLIARVVGKRPVRASGAWVWYAIDPARVLTLPVHPARWPLPSMPLPP